MWPTRPAEASSKVQRSGGGKSPKRGPKRKADASTAEWGEGLLWLMVSVALTLALLARFAPQEKAGLAHGRPVAAAPASQPVVAPPAPPNEGTLPPPPAHPHQG